MKRALRLVAILAGIAIIGCNRIDLVAPALISPADGAALYSGLAFIWGAGEEAEEYVIHVWTGSTDVIEDTLTDTTYTMSDSAFSALAYGIYNWAVASKAGSKLEWSESRTFSLTQPAAPKLIAPQDSAVFDTEPQTFIWSSDSLEPDYVIRIFTDTTIDLQDTLADTTYTMSDSVFENLSNGTYNWQAGTVVFNGVLLSETRSFIVDKPPPPLDLDTTYFPFGRGYEWCYERHNTVWDGGDSISDWYDTTLVKVIDSFWNADTLLFELEGNFLDLDNTVKIWGNQIVISPTFRWYVLIDTVDLIPEENTKSDYIDHGDYSISLWLTERYKADSFQIVFDWYQASAMGTMECDGEKIINRLRGLGVVYQRKYEYWLNVHEENINYRLLYFYNGQDTVWP
ncbi:hypothetical protein ES703_79703 [subsurface metagenome]